MKRFSIPNLVLAAALALLLPLEQLHCTCMGSQTHMAPVASHAEGGCCNSPAPCGTDHRSQPQQAPHSCTCPSMIAGVVPAVVTASTEAPTVTPLAVLTVSVVIAPVSTLTKTAPALDVGSPPLPDDPGAHGLRAPPVSA